MLLHLSGTHADLFGRSQLLFRDDILVKPFLYSHMTQIMDLSRYPFVLNQTKNVYIWWLIAKEFSGISQFIGVEPSRVDAGPRAASWTCQRDVDEGQRLAFSL